MSDKTIREARSRVRELRAAIAAGEAAKKAAEARAIPVRKRKAGLMARLQKQPILTQAAAMPTRTITVHVGDTREITLATIHVSRGYNAPPIKSKTAADELLSGGLKVSMGNGQDYTLRGALRRSVLVEPGQLVEVRKAEKAYQRARAALETAAKVVAERYAEAFAAGRKPDPAAIAALIAAPAALSEHYALTDDETALVRDGDEANRELRTAEFHLFWLTASEQEWRDKFSQSPGVPNERPAECPCAIDQDARRESERVAERDAKIAALPTAMRPCSLHGRHRVSITVGQLSQGRWTPELRATLVALRPELDRFLPPAPRPYYEPPITDIPVAWCLRDRKVGPQQLILAGDWLAQFQAAEKAAAKAAKAAAKPAPKRLARAAAGELHEGDVVAFTCPSCNEPQESAVETDADGDLVVGCANDEMDLVVKNLANVQVVRAAAAA